MQIITRGIAALVAVVTLAAALVLGTATVLADPSDPYAPGPPPVLPLPGCPGFSCFNQPMSPPPTNDGCHPDGYGAHMICPGPRTCGPFGCSDGSPSPG
jgi:hypothetical protein